MSETKTIEFLELVTKELNNIGVPASYEYPGYICIPTSQRDVCWNIGTANRETWGGELTQDGTVLATIDFDITADCSDECKIALNIKTAVRG